MLGLPAAHSPMIVVHPGPNPTWLRMLSEDVIEPELPIIDAHHHLYDKPGTTYLLDDLSADLASGHNVVATVHLQAHFAHRTDGPESLRPVGETEFVASVADEAERRGVHARVAAGIVGYADLTLGTDVEPVLAAHIAAGESRFKGIRVICARDPEFIASISAPPAFGVMASPAFRSGFALLDKYGLSFDAWIYHPQIHQLVDLARAFPETPIVLNHVGGPLGVGSYRGKRDAVFAVWRRSMKELASCSNVHVKLGGLGMALGGFDFHQNVLPPSSGELAAAWKPYMHATIEAFGVRRCMFESNFPVDKNSCSYPVLWNSYKRIAAGATQAEKTALFHDTAAEFYGIAAGSPR